MDETDSALSVKAKEYLNRKLEVPKTKITKLKRRRKIVKILYYSSIILSVTLSALLSALAGLSMIPIYIIPILSTTSGVLTALSAKFNLQNKKIELNKAIEKLNKLQEKLDYVISCNGNLTAEDFQQIISEISIL
jgi:hypothetical protein